MERTKLLTIAVVGLLLLNLFTVGFVLFRMQGLPKGLHEGPASKIIERLHLDAQQQEQFKALREEHQAQLQLLNQESVRLYTDYYSLLKMTRPDTAQAHALSRQIADNQQAIARINFAHFEKLKALCRPDQQLYFSQLVGDLAHLFGRRPGPAGGPPPGREEMGPPPPPRP